MAERIAWPCWCQAEYSKLEMVAGAPAIATSGFGIVVDGHRRVPSMNPKR
jgi:hypothetical protein